MPDVVLKGQGFGIFGKIPALGDFLRLNLPDGFAKVWDAWLQDAMATAKASLAADWDATYLSAPIWRFTLPAGQAGDTGVSGILMASVDRVGRQFPLTFVIGHAGTDVALTHFANRPTFEHLEDIALMALEKDTGRDELAATLADVTMVAAHSGQFAARRYIGEIPPDAVLASRALGGHDQGIWTSALPGDHRMLRSHVLPRGGDMLALLDPAAPDWDIPTQGGV